ncbi:MAG: NADH-quinone oxidoreductase subunit C [Planctomycetes bacterium]|nr:NADH-quinone oxidoreductase subunit C [Planctomycetota bacterium]
MSDAPSTETSQPNPQGLGALTLESAEADYGATGFHHRHLAAPESITRIANHFLAEGYVLEFVTAEDRRFIQETKGYEDETPAMRVAYTFNRIASPDRHLVLVDLPPEIPGAELPSIASIYPAADWHEREAYDMYGVRFTGHPNLERILLPEDADFHALLKDFGRPDAEVQDAGEHTNGVRASDATAKGGASTDGGTTP